MIADLPGLKLLELRNTGIRLPAGFFENATSLQTLELGSNDLAELQTGTFDGLLDLKLLNIWKNKFSRLEPDVFRGLRTLVSLDLNQNSLQTLPEDIFKVRVVGIQEFYFSLLAVFFFQENSAKNLLLDSLSQRSESV